MVEGVAGTYGQELFTNSGLMSGVNESSIAWRIGTVMRLAGKAARVIVFSE